MAVDKAVSLNIVKNELNKCEKDALRFGWDVFEIQETTLSFSVKMVSPIDSEPYLIEIQFDNYKELPLLIDFVDPANGKNGTKNAYPAGRDSFFNFHGGEGLICNPCSRKAYSNHKGPHGDWNLVDWENNAKTGALKNIHAVLTAICERISQPELYNGRMR
jgi:hypothetical protein